MLSDSGLTIKEVIDTLEQRIKTMEETTKVIQTNLGSIESKLDTLLDIEQGNWKIENNQMIFYRRNGEELMRFNLKDKNGEPTEVEIFERERIDDNN